VPSLCACEPKYTEQEEEALALKFVVLWEKKFQKELEPGVRASIDWMDPSNEVTRHK